VDAARIVAGNQKDQHKDVASIQFTSDCGSFTLFFEDGSGVGADVDCIHRPSAPPSQQPHGPSLPVPTGSPIATPPYTYDIQNIPGALPQAPGTVAFGALAGPLSDARLEPFIEWPPGGLTYDFKAAFGALWGTPVGVPTIQVSLYRVTDGTLELERSESKSVDPQATGYLDFVPKGWRPGTYRLEVTNGPILLAQGLAFIGPKCEVDCSGG
jgi:hypothetical protein